MINATKLIYCLHLLIIPIFFLTSVEILHSFRYIYKPRPCAYLLQEAHNGYLDNLSNFRSAIVVVRQMALAGIKITQVNILLNHFANDKISLNVDVNHLAFYRVDIISLHFIPSQRYLGRYSYLLRINHSWYHMCQ